MVGGGGAATGVGGFAYLAFKDKKKNRSSNRYILKKRTEKKVQFRPLQRL
jgi:uncharacterized membrane protein YebE (DUF533 family)